MHAVQHHHGILSWKLKNYTMTTSVKLTVVWEVCFTVLCCVCTLLFPRQSAPWDRDVPMQGSQPEALPCVSSTASQAVPEVQRPAACRAYSCTCTCRVRPVLTLGQVEQCLSKSYCCSQPRTLVHDVPMRGSAPLTAGCAAAQAVCASCARSAMASCVQGVPQNDAVRPATIKAGIILD
jgi:hypothetical protein